MVWSRTSLGGNRYSLDIEVQNLPAQTVAFVTVTSTASDIIESCTLEAWTDPTSVGSAAGISVSFEGVAGPTRGAIESIESLQHRQPLPFEDFADISVSIRLDPSAGDGRVGDAAGTTTLEALKFSSIFCRELTATLRPPSGFPRTDITRIEVDGNMVTIEAKNIYADIDVARNIEDILVFGSGGLSSTATDAVFSGSLTCNSLNDGLGLRVWGSIVSGSVASRTNINIAEEMNGISARIAIGKDLEEHASITIGSDGMERGITIGWMPGSTGSWDGDITVDGKLLSPVPDYEQTGLGGNPTLGGAVGLVPYGAHFFESSPAYNLTTGEPGSLGLTATNPSLEITIAHYGIVGSLPGAPTDPFLVYEAPGSHCTSGCSSEFFADKTSKWTTVGIGDGTNAIGFRDMKIRGIARFGQHYHVDVNGTLRCRDVFGEPTTAATKPYGFIFNTN